MVSDWCRNLEIKTGSSTTGCGRDGWVRALGGLVGRSFAVSRLSISSDIGVLAISNLLVESEELCELGEMRPLSRGEEVR